MSANTAVLGIANRRRLGQSLGRAPPTIRNDGTAIKFFNTYRALSEKSTLEKLSYIEIEADNLENLVADLCDFTLSHPIPRYYREGFEPPLSALANEDEPIKILRATVLSQYIGNIIKLIHFMFPEHEDFQDLDITDPKQVPSWWTRVRTPWEAEVDRYHFNIGGEYVHGATVTRPLYSTNNCTETNADDLPIADWVSKIDLNYVCKELIKGAEVGFKEDGKLQHRAMVSTTWMGSGRGGEAKFVDFGNWMDHPMIGCTDTVWMESKTLAKYAMSMFPYNLNYAIDWYHCIGSYWAVEGGLVRTAEDQGIESFLFKILHHIRNDSVASKVTGIIRSTLPAAATASLLG